MWISESGSHGGQGEGRPPRSGRVEVSKREGRAEDQGSLVTCGDGRVQYSERGEKRRWLGCRLDASTELWGWYCLCSSSGTDLGAE